MIQELSSTDIYFLVSELKALEGGRIEKIHQYSLQEFLFRIKTRQSKSDFKIVLPETAFLSDVKKESPDRPLGFCQFLRKYLDGAMVLKVEQYNFERIIRFEFDAGKEGNLSLFIELIKPGNLILCKDGVILSALTTKKYKNRIVKRGEEYVLPPSQPNTPNLSEKEAHSIFSSSEKSVVKTLATSFGLGGKFAEEVLFNTNIDKSAASKTLPEESFKLLFISLKGLFSREPSPVSYSGRVYPIKMVSLSGGESFDSFSKAIESTYSENVVKSKESGKYERIVETQEKRLAELESEELEFQKAAETIYNNYIGLTAFLVEAKKLVKDKEALIKYLKKHPNFKEYIEKDKKIILEL